MSDIKNKIIPLLIGADMNCYTVARAFHEEYGVISHAFGRWQMGETQRSKIVRFTAVHDLDNPDTLLATIKEFADQNKGKTCVVLGCTDDYAALLIEIKARLPKNCVAPYITPELRDKLVNKADYYSICDKYEIDYPKTFVAKEKITPQNLGEDKLGFEYPIIIKPSSSIRYWKFPFEGMKKVYTAQNPEETAMILTKIFDSGYDDTIILQDMIPGDDSFMRVLTAYSDRGGNVRMMCLGHVGLEEHTPKALGNHAAIITEYNEPLMLKFKAFLEDIDFKGFSNFDIKYDSRDGKYKVFEINLRQGRSNYYVTGSGFNLARYVVRDLVQGDNFSGCDMQKEPHFWHSVPSGVVFTFVKDAEFIKKAKALKAKGKESVSLGYSHDLLFNPLRTLYYLVHQQRYYKKFKTYYK